MPTRSLSVYGDGHRNPRSPGRSTSCSSGSHPSTRGTLRRPKPRSELARVKGTFSGGCGRGGQHRPNHKQEAGPARGVPPSGMGELERSNDPERSSRARTPRGRAEATSIDEQGGTNEDAAPSDPVTRRAEFEGGAGTSVPRSVDGSNPLLRSVGNFGSFCCGHRTWPSGPPSERSPRIESPERSHVSSRTVAFVGASTVSPSRRPRPRVLGRAHEAKVNGRELSVDPQESRSQAGQ